MCALSSSLCKAAGAASYRAEAPPSSFSRCKPVAIPRTSCSYYITIGICFFSFNSSRHPRFFPRPGDAPAWWRAACACAMTRHASRPAHSAAPITTSSVTSATAPQKHRQDGPGGASRMAHSAVHSATIITTISATSAPAVQKRRRDGAGGSGDGRCPEAVGTFKGRVFSRA